LYELDLRRSINTFVFSTPGAAGTAKRLDHPTGSPPGDAFPKKKDTAGASKAGDDVVRLVVVMIKCRK